MRNLRVVPVAVFVLMAVLVPFASAGSPGAPPTGFTPQVPISGLGMPFSSIDPSRLHITSTLSFGTSSFGGGMNGLQVTRLSYSFPAPVWMSVSLGSAFGGAGARNGQNFFLEGLDLAYRPSRAFQFQIHYQDIRSPLQLQGMGDPWNRYGGW